MLNIKELSDLISDKNAPAEDTRTTLIVIALVEQRIVLERIAELLDVHHMDNSEIESDLNRIALALEERNAIASEKFDALMKVIVDEPSEDELPQDEPDSDQPKTAPIE